MTLLITYDLHDKNYKLEMAKYLDAMHARMVTESSYVFVGEKSPATIVAEIRALSHDSVHVFVFTITKPFDGYGAT